MHQLADSGIVKFVICAGYRSDQVRAFVAAIDEPEWEVRVVDSGEDASITDRVAAARDGIAGKSLICYGDTIANVPLMKLVAHHDRHVSLATVTVYPLHSPFGVVEMGADDVVSTFKEKPILPHWINIGYLLCEAEALALVESGSDMPEFLDALAATGRFRAYRHTGGHLTVNTEAEREAAEARLGDLVTFSEEWMKW
jgi:glucose-1-phosphate cytidylyltransferase